MVLAVVNNSTPDVAQSQSLFDDCAKIDWFAFTLPSLDCERVSSLAEWVLKRLPDGAQRLEYGRFGYDQAYQVPGGGLVLYHPNRPEMGVHVELNADTLAFMDNNPVALVAWVLMEKGKVTRLDIAIDSDSVSMNEVVKAQESGNLVSRAQNRRLVSNYQDGSKTLYVGSPQARRMVRFYDKAKEQKVDRPGQIWTRCEVQFRHEQAQAASVHIVEGCDLRDLVFSSVDFRNSSQDENISRCDRLGWWSDWVGSVNRLSFALGNKLAETVEKVYEWVRKQVAPSLAFMDKFFGHDPKWLFDLLDANQYRISPTRQALLSTA